MDERLKTIEQQIEQLTEKVTFLVEKAKITTAWIDDGECLEECDENDRETIRIIFNRRLHRDIDEIIKLSDEDAMEKKANEIREELNSFIHFMMNRRYCNQEEWVEEYCARP